MQWCCQRFVNIFNFEGGLSDFGQKFLLANLTIIDGKRFVNAWKIGFACATIGDEVGLLTFSAVCSAVCFSNLN
jgi:hypothetical protein